MALVTPDVHPTSGFPVWGAANALTFKSLRDGVSAAVCCSVQPFSARRNICEDTPGPAGSAAWPGVSVLPLRVLGARGEVLGFSGDRRILKSFIGQTVREPAHLMTGKAEAGSSTFRVKKTALEFRTQWLRKNLRHSARLRTLGTNVFFFFQSGGLL